MSALTKIRLAPRFPRISRACATHEKEPSPWYRDNAPGPYPKTEEEKCAAAKKYGLLREEYEPYPDDGNGFGDYPKLQPINVEFRDPYYPWHDNHYRRNVGETIPVDFLAYIPGRIREYKKRYSLAHYFLGFLSVPIGVFLLWEFTKDYKVHHDTLEKQYYKPGVTYYTFDFEESAPQKHH